MNKPKITMPYFVAVILFLTTHISQAIILTNCYVYGWGSGSGVAGRAYPTNWLEGEFTVYHPATGTSLPWTNFTDFVGPLLNGDILMINYGLNGYAGWLAPCATNLYRGNQQIGGFPVFIMAQHSGNCGTNPPPQPAVAFWPSDGTVANQFTINISNYPSGGIAKLWFTLVPDGGIPCYATNSNVQLSPYSQLMQQRTGDTNIISPVENFLRDFMTNTFERKLRRFYPMWGTNSEQAGFNMLDPSTNKSIAWYGDLQYATNFSKKFGAKVNNTSSSTYGDLGVSLYSDPGISSSNFHMSAWMTSPWYTNFTFNHGHIIGQCDQSITPKSYSLLTYYYDPDWFGGWSGFVADIAGTNFWGRFEQEEDEPRGYIIVSSTNIMTDTVIGNYNDYGAGYLCSWFGYGTLHVFGIGLYNGGNYANPGNKIWIGGVTYGEGLTPAEQSKLSTIMHEFQSALERPIVDW